ncbi:MAG: carbon-nitrogen hydrolase family protein [Planctomycetota bacterium]|jgi:nitrilase
MIVAVAQVAPVFLDRERTIARVAERIDDAAAHGASLVCFGEALVPGYPIWLERTGGARFDDADQKMMHARYLREAVVPQEGHLDPVCDAARRGRVHVVLGVVERAADRGGHSLYCSRLVIGPDGQIRSVHRKLMPTYEERLAWAIGDGAGLVTHAAGDFTLGALLCWENWMPLARMALYAAGENLHVSLWPGGEHNTRDITRFIAREGRSYVIGACGLLRGSDIPADVPLREQIVTDEDELILNGGSAIAAPDGSWLVEPVVGAETLVTADIELRRVLEERQNFDPAGHYARPDVLDLRVNRTRHAAARQSP